MGEVYLAQDTLLERLVAVKFLSGVSPDEWQRERFRTEARAVARLQHPNIVSIHRIGEVQGRPYLVSELIRGNSLDKLSMPVPPEKALGIGMGLARGLAAAHRKGVLHRDIKPANAMLTEDGEVKLLDFGLAKLLDTVAESARGTREVPPRSPEASAPRLEDLTSTGETMTVSPGMTPSGRGPSSAAQTVAGAWIGTPRYMSPEVWRGEPATSRSDVYSLGGVLYELCTGHAPHQGESVSALRQAVLSGRAPPVATAAPGLDPRFAALIDRCLEPDPAHRFASGEELREALETLREGGPRELVVAERPYPGLHAFSSQERGVFFGRGAEVRALLERLRAEPFVLVAGDSGVGKSSLCRAGLLPRISEGTLGGSWSVAMLVPGPHPLAALASALASLPGLDEARVADAVRAGPWALGRLLRAREDAHDTLLFVDQLEELLTLAAPEEAALVAESLGMLAEGIPGVRLLATVRGDFITRLAALPGLGTRLSGALYLLLPLAEAGLREAITEPARARGFAFESEALVDTLVAAGRAEGGLPLLQFALAELWEVRDASRGLIPASALESLGGVSGALARHADGVLARLLPAQQRVARRLVVRLVTAEGTRARRPLSELLGGGAGEEERAVLEALVRGRLLVAREAEGEASYEVAHEALLTGWDVLRGWLAGDAERRAAHQRLERAAAEWQRLGRPREALWSARPLAEVAELEPGALVPQEAAFLAASRRAVRRQRLVRFGAVLALPLAAVLVYGGNFLLLRWQTEREVAAHVESAQRRLEWARQQDTTVQELRRKAFATFDSGQHEQGEELWASAVEQRAELYERGHDLARQELERALLREPSRAGTRYQLAGVLYERLLLAERDHQVSLSKELRRQLGLHDETGDYHRRLQAPARLQVETVPAGASVSVQRYSDEAGYSRPSTPRQLGSAPLSGLELEPGSYRLVLTLPDRPPVHYPVLLAQGEELRLRLPVPDSVPEGYVYVPPGRFLFGSGDDELLRRNILRIQPLHPVRTGGYLIARHEVTYGEWLRFLRELPPAERALRRPQARNSFGTVELVELPEGQWELTLQPRTHAYRAREGQRVSYLERSRLTEQDWLRLPVTGISWEDAQAYVGWLSRSGRLPGARLCDVREWERAARGADARLYPHGDRLAPEDANFDRTYGRQALAFGPDEVGSHPSSHSPFGVADLSGNVWEWVSRAATAPRLAHYSGGSFYQDFISARSNNHLPGEPSQRSALIGLRVCAEPPVPDPSDP